MTLDGVAIKPALALGGWVAFAQMHGEAMVMGDVVLLETEINPVMNSVLKGGLDVTAIHNHLLRASPATFYMHVGGQGDPVKMATLIRSALSAPAIRRSIPPTTTAEPGARRSISIPPSSTKSSASRVRRSAASISSAYRTAIFRQAKRYAGDQPARRRENGINFQPTSNGKALITGDFLVTGDEVNPLIRALRAERYRSDGDPQPHAG